MFDLPDLPYDPEDLQPVISAETMHFHHDKHHKKYVDTLNAALKEARSFSGSLEDIIRASRDAEDPAATKIFNNAAQTWNHTFFWNAMTPNSGAPGADLTAAIQRDFGGLEALKAEFVKEGEGHFGSGWVWLTAKDGTLKVISTHDADDTVARGDLIPLFVCDVWEHAYYLDYQNDRGGFLKAWFDALPNWALADAQFAASRGDGKPWSHPQPH